MDGDEWTDGRTHTVIKVHICGSWNFVISVGRAFPLPLNALERLRHFIATGTSRAFNVCNFYPCHPYYPVTAQLVCVFVFAYVLSCHENQSMPWVHNKNDNQHAHPCIRISAFLICSNGY